MITRRKSPFFPEPLSDAERDQLRNLAIGSIIAIVLLVAAFFAATLYLGSADWSNLG